jgi:hypothetical protein
LEKKLVTFKKRVLEEDVERISVDLEGKVVEEDEVDGDEGEDW